MPKIKPYVTPQIFPKQTRFITLDDGRVIPVTNNRAIRRYKRFLPQGAGSRFTVRFKAYVTTSELARIKASQARAERQAGIRVGNGLFYDPLAQEPKIIGVVKPQRKKQQHPRSGKLRYLRKKNVISRHGKRRVGYTRGDRSLLFG